MLRVVLRRIAISVPTLIVVMLLSFLLLELMPGDPAAALAGEDATPEIIDAIRANLGLDRPFHERFGEYFVSAIQGDLGESLITRRSVWDTIWSSLPPTVSLAVVSLGMVLIMSLVGGTLAAVKRDGWIDRAVSAVSAFGIATPSFVVAVLLIVPLALDRSIVPALGYRSLENGLGEWLRYLWLPAFALAINSAAELTRQVRGAMVDTLGQDFVMTTRASGLRPMTVIGKHVMKNSAIPVVTVLGLQVGRVLGSAVVIERIFAIPGFGSLAYSAVLQRDVPMVQGIVLVSAIVVLVTNFLVDMSYSYFNPRLRK